ncbi:MAG: hypothetical protein K8R74_14375 [Bacteroidales bacterium]|nr:hypothetical protein [Bacteroidales bacterium]
MKHFILIICILVFFIQVNHISAQGLELGLEAGLSYSFPYIRAITYVELNEELPDPKGKAGFNIGLNLNYKIFKRSGILFYTFYENINIKDKSYPMYDEVGNALGEIDNTIKNNYLNFGLYYSYASPIKIVIYTGFTMHFLLSSKTRISTYKGMMVSGKEIPQWFDNDYYSKTYFSLPIGLRYDFKRLYIKAQYSIGLKPAYRIENVIKEYHNCIEINLGYYFTLKK